MIDTYEGLLPDGAWPNWVLGNHDRHRIASRVGPEQARVAAMLLLTLRGAPTIYYGDEISMHDVPIPLEAAQDPFELNVPGLGLGRDPERTPMQWDASPQAGFSDASPWLPLAEDYEQFNVATERDDPRSMLTLYRRLIELRRREAALSVGGYAPRGVDGDLLAYERHDGERRFLIVLNLGHQPQRFTLQPGERGALALSTYLDHDREPVSGEIVLRADEGVVVEIMGG